MDSYCVRRSRLSLFIGYFLAEGVLSAILIALFIIWRDEPSYLDWPLASFSWVFVALFFHFLLFVGTFYKVQVNGNLIEYHAFLRKTKRFTFADIGGTKASTGLDIKIVGHDNKRLFYVKLTDQNVDLFLSDISLL